MYFLFKRVVHIPNGLITIDFEMGNSNRIKKIWFMYVVFHMGKAFILKRQCYTSSVV